MYGSPSPHFSVSMRHPRAWGVCDICNFRYPLDRLTYQYQWAGPNLANLRLRVCPTCYDTPQPQLRAIYIGPDPIPERDPRPGSAATQMGYLPVQADITVKGATGNRPGYVTGAPIASGGYADMGELVGGMGHGVILDITGGAILDTNGEPLFATALPGAPLRPNTTDRPGMPDQINDAAGQPLTDTTIPPWPPQLGNLTPFQARVYGSLLLAPGQIETLQSPPFHNQPVGEVIASDFEGT